MTATISKSNDNRTFGDVLRILRERAGASHRDVAGKCGVSRAEVQMWEHGTAYPATGRQTRALCDVMPQLKHYLVLLPVEQRVAARAEMGAQIAPQFQGDAHETAPTIDFTPLAPPTTFGEALRRARIHEGMGQEDVGEIIDVVKSTISGWEADEFAPVLDNYAKLLDVFPTLKDAPRPESLDREKPVGNTTGNGGPKPGGIVTECLACRDSDGYRGPHTCRMASDSARLPSALETPSAMVDRMGVDYARALMMVGAATAKITHLETELRTARAALEMSTKECDRVLQRLADAAGHRIAGKHLTPK